MVEEQKKKAYGKRAQRSRKPLAHPRKKLYVVLRRSPDGLLFASIDSFACMAHWHTGLAYIYSLPPESALDDDRVNGAFIARLNSKTCPIKVKLGNFPSTKNLPFTVKEGDPAHGQRRNVYECQQQPDYGTTKFERSLL